MGGRLRTRERTAVERSQRSAFASQRGDLLQRNMQMQSRRAGRACTVRGTTAVRVSQ